METICWIPILFVAYIVIKSVYETWREDKWREKTGRDKKDEFRVNILGKKTYKGWITISNQLKIFGWWGNENPILFLLGLAESFSEEIDYGELIKVTVDRENTAFQAARLLSLEIEKYSEKHIIKLRATNLDDVKLIEKSISERISEHNRKVEIEKIMRSRYKAGDFREISPTDFEKVIQELFTYMGYFVTRVGGSGDGGIDLMCESLGFNEKLIIQCKRYTGNVGVGIVRDFYGTLIHSKVHKGFIVTTSDFTKEAKYWVRGKPIELVNGEKLKELMMTYYR